MVQAFLFIWKYKILKDPVNLSYHVLEFFKLSKNNQRKVLNMYFDKLENGFSIESYFDTKEARYYDNHEEITFFNCYYFDKLIIEHDINNIKLVDKFKLPEERINFLIGYALEIIEQDGIKLDSSNLVNYMDNIASKLGKNIRFMKYLIDIDYSNIKYMVYNELCPSKQRDLIKEALLLAESDKYNLKKFMKQDNSIPSILVNNLDFILYLIKNDINNVKYLKANFLDNLTTTSKNELIKNIIYSLDNQDSSIEYIENIMELSIFLNRNEDFIYYILDRNLDNVKYVDWHNLNDGVVNNIINYITDKLNNNEISFDIMKYSFRDIFFQNYNFMKYLVNSDFRWIAVSKVNSKEDNDKLIDLFFDKIDEKKYKFKLMDFLEDGVYLNNNLVENKKMLHYLFINKVPLVQHINFFNLKSSRGVVENLVDELEKTKIDYKFKNEEFLIDGKYPVVLSNSYRFMRYVIDKNFNHIAYMDISVIDKREKVRIINYAFRMVYFIRGKNKNLSFDFDGYFKNSMIIDDEYFLECLRSL